MKVPIKCVFFLARVGLKAQGQDASVNSNNPHVAPAKQQQAAQPTSRTNGGKPLLEDGTPVKLRLTRNLSSADAHEGDTVDFEALEGKGLNGCSGYRVKVIFDALLCSRSPLRVAS